MDVIRSRIDTVLIDFLNTKKATAQTDGLPTVAAQALIDFLEAGGKRLRPLLCAVGWYTAADTLPPAPVIQVAAALEMFHAFCLIHDDVMDSSATRRGHPTVHRTLASAYGGSHEAGASGAILIGDLALTWSDELLHTAGLTPAQLAAVLPINDAMRTEVMYGQYLDLLATGQLIRDTNVPLKIIRYKTAKYTVERPLHIGAALGGAGPVMLEVLSEFALPLGEAFQLRDDLLGVFGNPTHTGKPALDDVREGKSTVLIALALQRATRSQARELNGLLGCRTLTEDQAHAARRIIESTRAHDTVNHMINRRYVRALAALNGLITGPAAIEALHHLADRAVRRHT
ncbi:polyprenyl synthetase family protein [Streptomyces vinaceus]|uniref:polyprenyl synthetase family protein n=1 Tax=Streptomyces vinaceus TaxID=1960 RepID=UPI0036B4A557